MNKEKKFDSVKIFLNIKENIYKKKFKSDYFDYLKTISDEAKKSKLWTQQKTGADFEAVLKKYNLPIKKKKKDFDAVQMVRDIRNKRDYGEK